MLAISTLPSRAVEPSVLGLWQKKDEANRTVGWFLFVEHKGTYEGAIAKLVSASARWAEAPDLLKMHG
jgi:hypothetical protein